MTTLPLASATLAMSRNPPLVLYQVRKRIAASWMMFRTRVTTFTVGYVNVAEPASVDNRHYM